ncbi:serine hydrolase domain-containing protein [Kutzneria viridogrisea]|uniref:Beta-lactamase n=2 Tax=Kutzneria TaxID=43356 RepID=W5VZK3_9PSEU|nr:serine hydrolase [Kutzneria albida]AHH93696.1 beta-lactamase [Kutzneria albida DSM 43870]MBA8931300.1 CubicO group peptidase (beta-lactamase class C family) [Kutzneria viridogrisea]
MRIRALALPAVLLVAFSVTASASTVQLGRFDRPYSGFAPSDTVLHRGDPASVGLDGAPIADYLKQLRGWQDGLFPSAVELMAHDGTVVSRDASGYAVKYADATTKLPQDKWVPARTDTIYDLASLSKLFTSIVAVQQLEAHRIELTAPVARYLPEYAVNGKGEITIQQLLTHTSGLAPDPVPPLWQYPDLPARRKAILDSKPQSPAGTTYVYSDLNMLSMQLVLEKVTGQSLDVLVRKGITEPLHMVDTGYNPSPDKLDRIAATEFEATPSRGMLRGSVHDENAWAMGGVAGHAGVFSTVDDLAVLSQAILNGGTYRGQRVLSQHGVALMETDFNQRFPGDSHGLGFELDQIWYMGGLSGPNTLGHTGYTGTSLVIDPRSRSFAILLTNRVHPTRNTPSTNPARRGVAQALAQAMPVSPPGGGRSWFSGQGGGSTSTLTTPALDAQGAVDLAYTAFVNTEASDPVLAEYSSDGGRTWQAVAGSTLSGQAKRSWQHVHATIPQAGKGLLVRWRYTTDPNYEGRGVNLAHLRISSGHRTLLDSDRGRTGLVASGWRELPA